MPAGQKLGAAPLRQFVRLIGIHPSGSGGDGTGSWPLFIFAALRNNCREIAARCTGHAGPQVDGPRPRWGRRYRCTGRDDERSRRTVECAMPAAGAGVSAYSFRRKRVRRRRGARPPGSNFCREKCVGWRVAARQPPDLLLVQKVGPKGRFRCAGHGTLHRPPASSIAAPLPDTSTAAPTVAGPFSLGPARADNLSAQPVHSGLAKPPTLTSDP